MHGSTTFSSIMRKGLSGLYGFIISARNHLYDKGLKARHDAGLPVVSIGNIEVGGTGKTPFTIALCRELSARGHKPVIVTRGYKGRLKGVVQVEPGHDFRDVGDEALFMARVAGVPVVKSPDRVRGALYARDKLQSDIVLLDDGFQHRKIKRDLDIVLVSGDMSEESLLPLGRLREPLRSLGRADIVVYTKGSGNTGFRAELIPAALVDVSGRLHDLTGIKGKKVLAVSGIARPQHFISTLEELGATVKSLSFRDHHAFTPRDMEKIMAGAYASDLIITTEKDMVRLDPSILDDRWLALRVEMRIEGMETIIREIQGIVKKSSIPRQG